jgi:ATP-binding cassette subfamily B protein
MNRFPFSAQLDAMDCGVVCLQMIATYYNRHYSLEQLRNRCFITREGVSLLGISKAAEEIGFRTLGGKFTFKQLVEKAPLPCIVHWQQDHFVIVYRIRKRRKGIRVYVADPGKGLTHLAALRRPKVKNAG